MLFLCFPYICNILSSAESVHVVIQSLDHHPVCEHGPSLLFERQSGSKLQQFYACSAYRDQTECSLYVPIERTEEKEHTRDLLLKSVVKSLKLATEKSILLQEVKIDTLHFQKK